MMGSALHPTLAAAAEKSAAPAPPAETATAVTPWLNAALELGLVLLVIAIILCIYRLMKGPSLADRVTAADTLALEVIGLVIVLAIRLETTIFFDAALVVAIVGFASTVAFAQYIGAGGASEDETEM
jgi:multicomponent K+:H+ antiporter subunit F